MKPRFRILFRKEFLEGFYLSPLNYEAETIHLTNVYGHSNGTRRFSKEEKLKNKS